MTHPTIKQRTLDEIEEWGGTAVVLNDDETWTGSDESTILVSCGPRSSPYHQALKLNDLIDFWYLHHDADKSE